MPSEAIRFIHASQLLVDHQLTCTGPLTDKSLRETVEDATLTAWDRVVVACIERKADFLLLTGDSFDRHDRSLRAEVALRDGFNRLIDNDIQVVVIPGARDTIDAWNALADLPEDVIVFRPEFDEPVAILRDGKCIASITGILPVQSPNKLGQNVTRSYESGSTKHPLSVGILYSNQLTVDTERDGGMANEPQDDQQVLPPGELVLPADAASIDYIAIVGNGPAATYTLGHATAHQPGSTQGQSPDDTGAHGCTLVEYVPGQGVGRTFLPTSTVRWETFPLHVEFGSTQDALVAQMFGKLQTCQHKDRARVWMISWKVEGCGPMMVQLRDKQFCNELLELAELESPLPDRSRLVQQIDISSMTEIGMAASGEGPYGEFVQRLQKRLPVTDESLASCLEWAEVPPGPWRDRLVALSGSVCRENISRSAHQQTHHWFSAATHEGRGA